MAIANGCQPTSGLCPCYSLLSGVRVHLMLCFKIINAPKNCPRGLKATLVNQLLRIGELEGKCLIFTARRSARIASAVLAIAIPSACPSVRLSHAGSVSKRRHVARCSVHCRIAKCA